MVSSSKLNIDKLIRVAVSPQHMQDFNQNGNLNDMSFVSYEFLRLKQGSVFLRTSSVMHSITYTS
ncbi:hypothetical protein F383_03908 [Gossypium arboreum]|uniref:Uncharacterized protein n=1 Tax=Gossypium arboreum TaxID=29729 RepID=A0A0B0PNU1_GOSAR|nr:hypothetical protein F383_03908 [Gossypium arboreum]